MARDKCAVKLRACRQKGTASMNFWIRIGYVVLLPLVSPYGIGIHAGQISPTMQGRQTSLTRPTSKLDAPPSILKKRKPSGLTELSKSPDDQNSSENSVNHTKGNVSNKIYQKNGSVQKTSKSQQATESNASIISRLLFFYASPLTKLASMRQLESSDAFKTPDENKMEKIVPGLQKIYDKCRSKARRRLEKLRAERNTVQNRDFKRRIKDKIVKSESLVLLKAIIMHQKKMLIMTGLLRLVNTSIQAFPALLVARLLRIIEAGETHHPLKPIQAALLLVGVLSLKMIVENQYFHMLVKSATQVRGSLSGMIFDKSLRLSSAGASDMVDGEERRLKDKSNTKKKIDQLGVGGVMNLMQSDTSQIEFAALQVHTIWDGLLQIAIYTTLLFKVLGPSVKWGFLILLLQIPTNIFGLRVLSHLSKKLNEAKDSRTRKTTEALSNMKLLKLQAWDNSFEEKIQQQREEELRRQLKRGTFQALNSAISNAVPSIILVVTLGAYKRAGGAIIASTVFTAISLFNQLRFPLYFYPLLIDTMANGKQSMRRISSYLCQEELSNYVHNYPQIEGDRGRIEMKNGNFLWSSAKSSSSTKTDVSLPAAALCGAEVIVKPGEVVAVVGPVGSGKTALIKALLGELEPTPSIVGYGMMEKSLGSISVGHDSLTTMDVPSVSMYGDVAYCAQEAWLSTGTIKEAVVFGREFDEDRYLSALYDAGLDEDISGYNMSEQKQGALSHNTEVGEGGLSLSGGQRARVQLARALYHDAGVYLLDDPLSALDAAVGVTVFERMIKRFRQRKAAVVFVTNDPALPQRCDRVVLMENVKSDSGSPSCSRILDTGTYDELISRGHTLKNISVNEVSTVSLPPNQHEDETEFPDLDNHDPIKSDAGFSDHSISTSSKISYVSGKSESLSNHVASSKLALKDDDNDSNDISIKVKTADDMMKTGVVPFSTYTTYLRSVRKPQLIVFALASVFMVNGAQFFQQFVVAKWTELGQEAVSTALGGKHLQLLAYAAMTASVFLFLRSYTIMSVGIRASQFFHSRMLSTVFRAPVSFFETTPSGQLFSRFGKEMETIDRSLPSSFASVLYCFLQIFMTMIALAGVVTPKIIPPLIFIGFSYRSTMSRFRPASRDLKRCETKTRSPIYTHFGEALRGAETIRSFRSSSTLWSSQNRQLTDDNLSTFYTSKALDRWLSIRLESLGNLIVLSAAFAAVILTRTGNLKAGMAGWGLTQALSITGLLTWAVRVLTDLENQMMSVMRVKELINIDATQRQKGSIHSNDDVQMVPVENEKPGAALNIIPQESSTTITVSPDNDHDLVESLWPWKGEISFKNVAMRYTTESPLVLKDVTISVPPASTLGIVGRTGSGKSTMLLTLFRISEIEMGGSIEIDGVDIRSVSLKTLRRSLSIIPQDPVLFAGTVMYNLDVTGEISVEDGWAALEAASPDLARQFRISGQGLNSMITEGGKNLSSGQRQLICLARALLRKSKILVLDEATSSVDSNTDAQVQNTIRREFVNKGVSVIVVAHRLDTVLGLDKIAVLDAGTLVEYGAPNDLLKIRNGKLKGLVESDRGNQIQGVDTRRRARYTEVK